MNFNDIFKSSFLEKSVQFSILDVTIAMLVAFAIGFFIFTIYKKTYTGVMYSSGFGISIIAMTLITTLIILAVTSNIVLSLGMVGALSIVRFRTAVKEPLDIAFLFWSISVGIVTGAGLIPLAVIGSIIIGAVLYFFSNKKCTDTPYIIVLNIKNDDVEADAMNIIKTKTKKHIVKSKIVSKDGVELTIEVRLIDMSTVFVNQLLSIEGINNAVLVSYNGDYTAYN